MWCEFRFPANAGASVDLLLSTSLFYMPGYTKVSLAYGVRDLTHERQASFISVLEAYEEAFRTAAWLRERVALRVYHDDSLDAYVAPDGSRPYPALLRRLAACPGIQLVWFRVADPRFRSADGAFHVGVFGAFVRFHALIEGVVPTAKAVCLIDMDSFYTPAFFERLLTFACAGAGALAFTGPLEITHHAWVAPEDAATAKPNAKGCFTAFRSRFPTPAWDDFASAGLDALVPHMRYLDAMLLAIFGPSSSAERLYEEFAYGADELILNAWLRLHGTPVQEVRLVRSGVGYVFHKLAAYLRWNGERSVAARALAAALKHPSVDALVKTVERDAPGVTTLAALKRYFDGWRPHAPLLAQLQIDGRILAVVADERLDARAEAPHVYMVDAGGARKALAALVAWRPPIVVRAVEKRRKPKNKKVRT